MAKNKLLVPEAKKALEKIKFETATEAGIQISENDQGDKPSKLNGRTGGIIGGQMVKKMIADYENKLCNK